MFLPFLKQTNDECLFEFNVASDSLKAPILFEDFDFVFLFIAATQNNTCLVLFCNETVFIVFVWFPIHF